MSDQEIEFNKFFDEEGGIYRGKMTERTKFHSTLFFANMLIRTLNKTDGARDLDIYVDVIDNFSVNVCVGKKGERYYIGINVGVLVLLSNILFRMFSSNSILTEIGDASKESATRKIHDVQIKDIQKLLDNSNEDLIPKDETRLAAASFFFKSIVEFIVLHEYAHIIDGHMDYCIDTLQMEKSFGALSEDAVDPRVPIFQQTMELQADDFAIFMCLLLLRNTQLGTFPVNPLLKPYFKDWKSTSQFWYLPIYTYFRLFGHCNETKSWYAALIEDRLLMHEGKKQIYGSQVVTKPQKYQGKYFVWPLQHPDRVNELRKKVGLELTVEENAKRLDAIYNPNEELP